MRTRTRRAPGTARLAVVLALLVLPLLAATACSETQADVQAELGAGESDLAERLPAAGEEEGRSFLDRLSGDDIPKTVQIPAGTRLAVRLDQPVASHVAAEGQSLRGELTAAVTVRQHTVLPAGSVVWAVVEQARPHPATRLSDPPVAGPDAPAGGAGGTAEGSGSAAAEAGAPERERNLRTPARPGEPALLEISFERVETDSGRRVPISATLTRTGPPEPSKEPTAKADSAEVVIPAGTEVTVALERATSVELPDRRAD